MVVKWVMNAVSYWLQRNSSPKKENCHHLFTLMLFQTHMTSVEHKRRDSKNSSLHVNEMDGNWSLLVKTPHKIIIWVVHTCALHPKSSEAKSFFFKKKLKTGLNVWSSWFSVNNNLHFKFFVMVLFSKDALNWSKVALKTFIIVQKISVKVFFFFVFFFTLSWENPEKNVNINL